MSKMYKSIFLYLVFPVIGITSEVFYSPGLKFWQIVLLFSVAFILNFIFMKLIGERLFTYKS